jgi:hypothetical protein
MATHVASSLYPAAQTTASTLAVSLSAKLTLRRYLPTRLSRNAIHAFDAHGVAALRPGSTRPHTLHTVVTPERAERLRALLHQSPRTFGQPTSVWTLDRAAQVSFEQGLLPERVSGETIRLALKRLGVGWKRAKRWLTSPDPAYARKKAVATG